VTNPIWSSDANSADNEGYYFAKFVPPTIADGQVYVASFPPDLRGKGKGHLIVYGMQCSPACVGSQCVHGSCQ
jgi:hypothetical protein